MQMHIQLQSVVPNSLADKRLDQALAELFPNYSRAQMQTWIRAGYVSVNGLTQTKIRAKIKPQQLIQITALLTPHTTWVATPIPLDIIYQDDHILVVNKPAGLVVHPGAGISTHTLLNALLHYDPSLAAVPRAGIIHRLDKNTSGLLLVAKTLSAHNYLVQAMKKRAIHREYQGVVKGVVISGGSIHTKIGRHSFYRTKMQVTDNGKDAVTHYRIIQRFRAHTHLRFILETGRTHQIRVHMAHLHFPLVGDPTYGQKSIPPKLSPLLQQALTDFPRQALHATRLKVIHPITGCLLSWESPLSEDITRLLDLLHKDLDSHPAS